VELPGRALAEAKRPDRAGRTVPLAGYGGRL